MTQIPTDAMIEAGVTAWMNAGGHLCDSADLVGPIYTAMESARDPDELREALEDARAAIASLDEDALGMDDRQNYLCDPHPPYPIRDELLAKIDTALSRNVGDVG